MPCRQNSSSGERSRHPSCFFLWKDVPAIFSKKGKKEKTGASESVITEEDVSCRRKREREKRKSERKESSCLSGSRPWEKSEEKRRIYSASLFQAPFFASSKGEKRKGYCSHEFPFFQEKEKEKAKREKAGVSILWSGSSLLQKKGNASRCGIRKKRKGKPSPAHRGRISSCLSFRKKKRRKEKHRPFLAAPPFSYVPSSALF